MERAPPVRHEAMILRALMLAVVAASSLAQMSGTAIVTHYSGYQNNVCQYRNLNEADPIDGLVAIANGLPLGTSPVGPASQRSTFNKCGYCVSVQCTELPLGQGPGGCKNGGQSYVVRVGDQCDDARCNGMAAQGQFNFDFPEYTWKRVMGDLPGPGEGRVEWQVVPCSHVNVPITANYINSEPWWQRLTFQDVGGSGRIDRVLVKWGMSPNYVEAKKADDDGVYWTFSPNGLANPVPFSLKLYQGGQEISCNGCVGQNLGTYVLPACTQFTPHSVPGCANGGGGGSSSGGGSGGGGSARKCNNNGKCEKVLGENTKTCKSDCCKKKGKTCQFNGHCCSNKCNLRPGKKSGKCA